MNYVLQVVRGRSATTTLKLNDGVNTIGRHDDCMIRIKSSQVSRRHCELVDEGENLTLRDLGSSNGTFVNGKRVAGQKALKHGDELTLGAVTLRVAKLGQPAPGPVAAPKPKAGDTAVVDAVEVDESDHEEFELEFDDGEPAPEIEGIPLADDDSTLTAGAKVASPASAKQAAAQATPVQESKAGADDAIADFLLDLKLDDEEA
jgi:predicted component of type VI protein secretion system